MGINPPSTQPTIIQAMPNVMNSARRLVGVVSDKIVVTESGIATAEDVVQMHAHEVYAFLVGEAFMREAHAGDALKKLFF